MTSAGLACDGPALVTDIDQLYAMPHIKVPAQNFRLQANSCRRVQTCTAVRSSNSQNEVGRTRTYTQERPQAAVVPSVAMGVTGRSPQLSRSGCNYPLLSIPSKENMG
jgi:hypothetical protein